MQQVNFGKKKNPPHFYFHKYCVVASMVTAKELYEETICHFVYTWFYMTVIGV